MSHRPEIKTWVSLLAVLGFAVFVVYLLFFTDLVEVAVIISGVNVPIYFLAFACILCVVLFNALAWKATLDNVSVKTTFKRVFNLVWVGAFLDCIIPGNWSGDIFMTYLLGRDEGVDVIKVAAAMVIKDILELLVIIVSLIVGMSLLVLNYSIDAFILTAIGITMIFLALPLILIVYLSTNVSVTKRILQFLARIIARIKHKKPSAAFEQKIAAQIANFHDVIMIIKKKPKSMIKPIVYQTMGWIFNTIALYFVFISLGPIVGLDKVIITNTIVGNVSHQGVALVGFSQIISSSLYQILGISTSMAQATSLLSSFADFWFRFIIAFVFFEMYGLGTIAEKILSKAFKEKKKQDTKDFKEQTDSNQRDFEEKTGSDKKDYKEQEGIDKKDFKEKTDSDKKDFKKLSDNKERDYKEQKDSDKQDYDDKRDSDEKAFADGRDSDKQDYDDKHDSDEKDYEGKRNSGKKDFKERMDKDEKDFKDKKDSEK